jgi:hypothetical protein
MTTDRLPLWLEMRRRYAGVHLVTQVEDVYLEAEREEPPSAEPLRWHQYEGCLWEFIKLRKAQELQAFAGFANKWGMLGLCEHGAPAPHTRELQGGRGLHACTPAKRESIADWEAVVTRARALMFLAADINTAEDTYLTDWMEAAPELLRRPPRLFLREVNDYGRARLYVNELITQWAERGNVNPSFVLDEEGTSVMALRSTGVYGVLGAQMGAVLVSQLGPYRCWLTECRDPGPSKRKLAEGVPFYCSEECRQEVRRATFRKSKAAKRKQTREESAKCAGIGGTQANGV